MRIAIVHSFYKRSTPSGENAAVINQVELLKKAGHEVCLISAESDEIRKIDQINLAVKVAYFRGPSPLNKILEFNPDVVHIHNLFPNFGQRWVHDLKIPHVFTFHNFRPMCAAGTLSRESKDCFECPERGSHRALVHRCYKDSTLATLPLAIATRNSGAHNPSLNENGVKIVLSDFSKEMYLKHYSSNLDIRVLPNFAERTDKSKARQSNSSVSPWVYIGRLSPEKGILELLSNWPEGELLHVYGTGDLEAQLHRDFGSNQNIVFQGSLMPTDRAATLLSSKGLLFPSVCRENSPLVIGEAYSAGIPVIAFSGNVAGENISKYGGGVSFDSFSELGNTLKVLESIRKSQITVISEIYESQYSPETWLNKLMQIYESIRKAQ
jgi:glycosyltransferase involved in cell wall biosynthesis